MDNVKSFNFNRIFLMFGNNMQLKFNFECKPEVEFFLDEIERMEVVIANLRKGLFSRHGQMQKEIDMIKDQIRNLNGNANNLSDLPLFEYAEKKQNPKASTYDFIC